MKFGELVDEIEWEEVKEALERNYEPGEENLEGYQEVFWKLKTIEPTESKMRICIEYVDESKFFSKDVEPECYWNIFGRNGTINKDTEDAPFFKEAKEEWLNAETTFAIEFTPWKEWLAMEIDKGTANNIELMRADIVAHCLYELTFCGYEEEEIAEKMDEINKSMEEVKNMSKEDLEKNTIPLDELENFIEDLKNKDDDEDDIF